MQGEDMELLEYLHNLLPEGLAIAEKDRIRIQSALSLRRMGRGDYLLAPGDVCALEGIVTRGCLRVYFTESDGTERVLYFAPEGWGVADIESLAFERPAELAIEALEPTDVWVMDKVGRASLQSELHGGDRIWSALTQRALVALQKRLMGGMRKAATERYYEFRRTYPGLESRIPQYHIAAYLGISPEFLCKLRKRLQRAS
jgi:CRP-like cAMP-binding protein